LVKYLFNFFSAIGPTLIGILNFSPAVIPIFLHLFLMEEKVGSFSAPVPKAMLAAQVYFLLRLEEV